MRNYTWHRNDTKARLDKIYISDWMKTHITMATIKNSALAFSEHALVKLTVSLKEVKTRSPVWYLNLDILKQENYIEIIKTFWSDWTTQKHKKHRITEVVGTW